MPLALDLITPLVQVLVTITSQVSPSKMKERAADKEIEIVKILEQNWEFFSEQDWLRLSYSEENVLTAQSLLPSTRFRDIIKHPVNAFAATRGYYNEVNQYYGDVKRISASAARRHVLEKGTGCAGEEHPHPRDHLVINGPSKATAPGTLYLQFKDLKIEAGAGADLEVQYDEGGSFKLKFKKGQSDESGRPCKGKVPRSYSVSGVAELVPDANAAEDGPGRAANLGMSMPSYSVRSITNFAIAQLEDGSEDDDEDTMSFMTAYDGDGTSIVLSDNGSETFSIPVDMISIATVDSVM